MNEKNSDIADHQLLPSLQKAAERKAREIDALVHADRSNYAIDRNSTTWLAVKKFIKEQVQVDYMPALRMKGADHGQTEHARGAMDAFDSLLEFGGEEI